MNFLRVLNCEWLIILKRKFENSDFRLMQK